MAHDCHCPTESPTARQHAPGWVNLRYAGNQLYRSSGSTVPIAIAPSTGNVDRVRDRDIAPRGPLIGSISRYDHHLPSGPPSRAATAIDPTVYRNTLAPREGDVSPLRSSTNIDQRLAQNLSTGKKPNAPPNAVRTVSPNRERCGHSHRSGNLGCDVSSKGIRFATFG